MTRFLLVLSALAWLASASAQTPPAPTNAAPPAVVKAASDTDKVLRLNFRGVPLEQVLDYFGEAAGFVITPKVEIGGRVTVWSADPLTRDEAVTVLNSALARNGLGAIRSGRTLSIVGLDEARRRNTPVRRGDNPDDIPPTEDLVTQIIPVKFVSAPQLLANLEPLLASASGLSANEGANALVLTDTQASVRRVAEIVKALDTPIAAFSAVKVFALKFADAKALASVLKDLFAPQDSSRSGSGGNQVQQTFTGGPGGGGPGGPGGFGANPFGGGGNAGSSSRSSTGRVSTPRMVAAVDEQSNSLIVSAPEEQMPLIEDVVKQVDVPVEDVTELRVFKLQNAQPEELASTLKSLFPDPASSSQGNSSGPQFASPFGGGGPGGPGGGNLASGGTGGASTGSSERRLKQGRVNTVADARTGSLLVSAAPALMEQIAGIVTQLDADPARKQKVFVIPVQNSDPAQIQSILQGLFPTLNGSSSSSRQSASVNGTTTRGTTTGGSQNQTGRNNSQGTGSSGFGSTGSSGLGASTAGGGGR